MPKPLGIRTSRTCTVCAAAMLAAACVPPSGSETDDSGRLDASVSADGPDAGLDAGPPLIPSGPALAEELLWPQAGGSADQRRYSRSARSTSFGAVWTTPTVGDRINAPPVVAGGVVVALGTRLWAIERRTGAVLWSTDATNWSEAAAPALAGERVIVSGTGVVAHALSDGSVLWRRDDLSAGGSSVVLHHGLAFVVVDETRGQGDRDGPARLVGLAPDTGVTAWEISSASRLGTPAIAGNRVFTADTAGRVAAWDRVTSALVWERSIPPGAGGWPTPVLTVEGARVLVAQRGGGPLTALDASDGRTLWTSSPTEVTQGELVAAYGLVFAEGPDRRITAWNVDTGEVRWTGPVGWPLAAMDGLLVVSEELANEDGTAAGRAVRVLAALTGAAEGPPLANGYMQTAVVACGRIYGGFRDGANGFKPALRALGDEGDDCPVSSVY